MKLGDTESAIRYMEQELKIQNELQSHTNSSIEVAKSQAALGAIMLRERNFSEALNLLTNAHRVYSIIYGDSDVRLHKVAI
jgi:hypothetical protein